MAAEPLAAAAVFAASSAACAPSVPASDPGVAVAADPPGAVDGGVAASGVVGAPDAGAVGVAVVPEAGVVPAGVLPSGAVAADFAPLVLRAETATIPATMKRTSVVMTARRTAGVMVSEPI